MNDKESTFYWNFVSKKSASKSALTGVLVQTRKSGMPVSKELPF